jgi:hypothetical protein
MPRNLKLVIGFAAWTPAGNSQTFRIKNTNLPNEEPLTLQL